MKQFLKYGGLFMSSLLTIGLFIDLFGNDAYGILMAGAALALFEGGSIAWAHILTQAKYGQRIVARFAMWFCVLASITSSGAQIIMTTDLWKPQFDTGFIALATVVLALVVNVAGIFGYEYLDPERAEINRELDRGAKTKSETDKLTDRLTNQALIKAGAKVNDIAGQVSDALASEIQHDVMIYLLSQTRGGANTIQLPAAQTVIDQPAQATATRPAAAPPQPKPQPSRMEDIKDTLRGALFGHDAQPQTMSAEGTTIVSEPATPQRTPSYTPPRHEERTPAAPAAQEVSTEEWRLNNARADLARAEHAHHGTPPNMRDGESLFRPHDPMAYWNDTRLENDLHAAQAAYNQALANYNAAQSNAAPKA
jgi:hypothetical protein